MEQTEKIRLMARLAMIEKDHKAALKRADTTFRSDYYEIPMLKNALKMTVIFLAVLMLFGICRTDFFFVNVMHIRELLICLGVSYLVCLVITLVVTWLKSARVYDRDRVIVEEYQRLLKELREED